MNLSENPPRCLACSSNNFRKWTQSRDIEYYTTEDVFTYNKCSDCDALFIDPVPQDRLSEIYPSNYYSFAAQKDSFINNVKKWLDANRFRSIFKQIDAPELNVLDIGGGAGWQLNSLREIDSRVKFTQVVDIDPKAEKLARENGHEYFCGIIENFTSEKKFHLILVLNLIEHVADPTAVLKKVGDLLADDGVILLQTPNYESLDERLFRSKSWGGYHCPRHWVLFTKDSFLKTVERAGLSVKNFAYTQGAAFWAVSLLDFLKEKNLVKVNAENPAVYHPLFGILSAISAGFDFVRSPFAKTSQMFVTLKK